MRVLILGGTQFIGREIAEVLRFAGHAVTVLNRGHSPDELPADIERLRGDRDEKASGLDTLKGRSWDACVDMCGYTPRQVRLSAEMLRASVERYVFMSAVSVYGDPQDRPIRETQPRMPAAGEDATVLDQDTYGRCKVACEDIVQQLYGGRCTLLRPQIVVGPHDPDGRYAFWVHRAMRPGEMLAPGDGSDHLQVIDVRDVAHFTKAVIENDLGGAFNLAGPRLTWSEFMTILGAKNIVWVDADIIKSAGLTESNLPLFRPERGERSGLMDVSNERARAAGLMLSDPKSTMEHARASILAGNAPPALTPEHEAELIRLTRRDGDSSQNRLKPGNRQ